MTLGFSAESISAWEGLGFSLGTTDQNRIYIVAAAALFLLLLAGDAPTIATPKLCCSCARLCLLSTALIPHKMHWPSRYCAVAEHTARRSSGLLFETAQGKLLLDSWTYGSRQDCPVPSGADLCGMLVHETFLKTLIAALSTPLKDSCCSCETAPGIMALWLQCSPLHRHASWLAKRCECMAFILPLLLHCQGSEDGNMSR